MVRYRYCPKDNCGGDIIEDQEADKSPHYKWLKCVECGQRIKQYNSFKDFVEH